MSFNNSLFKLKDKRKNSEDKSFWMPPPVSHGYHAVQWNRDPANSSPDDLITAQRQQIGEDEVCFFGIVDDQVGNRVSKHLQSNLFDNKKKLRCRNSKEALREAHKNSRMGSAASAIVINGKKLVMANMGGYRCLVCRNGKAYQLGSMKTSRLCFNYRTSVSEEVMVGEEKIDSRTEFVILASYGIWEVMKNQEAVNLISHLEDPQEAAECLAKEALNRMSKINISCIVIRFNYHN